MPLRPRAALAACAVAGALAAPAALAQEAACPGRILVEGQGEIAAVPDLLRLTFRAEAEGRGPQDALSDVAARVTAMTEALSAAGVAERDLQTTEISLSPLYSRPEPGNAPRTVGWRAAGSLRAAVRDLSAFGATVDAATKAGATGLHGIAFEVSDREAKLAEARSAAVRDALARARSMAEAAGLSAGEVLELRDGAAAPPPMPYPARAMVASEAMADMPVSPGEQRLTATVSATVALCR